MDELPVERFDQWGLWQQLLTLQEREFRVRQRRSGSTTGVYGESISTSGRGVIGDATSETGTTYGVVGYSASPDGYAGYFRNTSSGRGLYVQWLIRARATLLKLAAASRKVCSGVERDGDVYADGSFTRYRRVTMPSCCLPAPACRPVTCWS